METQFERHFSAAYYSEVFEVFDVKLVIRCCESTYDESAFVLAGMAVEELAMPDEIPVHMLQRIDRFLTLLALSPGPVVVHSDGMGLGPAEVLASAYLIRRHGMQARAAVARVRMVHPATRIPGLLFSA